MIAVSRASVKEITKRLSLTADTVKKAEEDVNGEETLSLMR